MRDRLTTEQCKEEFWRGIVLGIGLVLAILAGVALLALMLASVARSHEWLPTDCCNDRDCWPLVDGEVEEVPGGYRIGDEVIPFDDDRVRYGVNPTDDFYRCTLNQNPEAYTNCLFPPGAGA